MFTEKYITPIYQLGHIQNSSIYIKRDDILPYSFGGNKVRKAYKFFQTIDSEQYNCIVTYGSGSSNHCRVMSNMAAQRGMDCWIISPEEASEATFNSQMTELLGARRIVVPVERVHDTIEETLSELCTQGYRPYFIPGGGHGNIGTRAYVECYEEIRQYEREYSVYFDYIFLASGTGTTQAGLVCGQLLNDDARKIVGISIARKNPRGRDVVLQSIRDYLAEVNVDVTEEHIQRETIFIDDYVGSGYAGEDAAVRNTIRDLLLQYGIPMDGTYTGKAFHGMKQYLNKEDIKGKNVLFIHTGGTPLFFDDLKRMGWEQSKRI